MQDYHKIHGINTWQENGEWKICAWCAMDGLGRTDEDRLNKAGKIFVQKHYPDTNFLSHTWCDECIERDKKKQKQKD